MPPSRGSEHLDRLAAENGDMAWRSRAHAPAPGVFRSMVRRLDANGPIAPQISALRRAFPAKKPLQDAIAISRPTRHSPVFPTEFAGLPWHFERERGPRPSPIPGSALHHSVTAFSVKKRLTKGCGFSALSRPLKAGDAHRTHSGKMRGMEPAAGLRRLQGKGIVNAIAFGMPYCRSPALIEFKK